MKKFLILLLLLVSGVTLRAQEYRVDSLRTSEVDSTLVGRSILSVLGGGVTVNQSPSMRAAFDRYLAGNAAKKMSGYRIRVYFDNGQSARNRSEAIARSISYSFPGIGVYRTFASPNFKVSVGDFRTKDEALKVYQALKATYPTALILKETINYPR
ncbi:MAG: hypothetical protein II874_06670 [Bacteroidales bacterium]|nr:hypothetical protein [Bacteroidales bacterium]